MRDKCCTGSSVQTSSMMSSMFWCVYYI
jgi:hypothetical protein